MSNVVICGPYPIGCFASCTPVQTNLVAMQDGQHRVEYETYGIVHTWFFEATFLKCMTIPNKFKEVGESCFKIVQPDGTYFSHQYNTTFLITNNPVVVCEIEESTVLLVRPISPPIDWREKPKVIKKSEPIEGLEETKPKKSTPLVLENCEDCKKDLNQPLVLEPSKPKISTPIRW